MSGQDHDGPPFDDPDRTEWLGAGQPPAAQSWQEERRSWQEEPTQQIQPRPRHRGRRGRAPEERPHEEAGWPTEQVPPDQFPTAFASHEPPEAAAHSGDPTAFLNPGEGEPAHDQWARQESAGEESAGQEGSPGQEWTAQEWQPAGPEPAEPEGAAEPAPRQPDARQDILERIRAAVGGRPVPEYDLPRGYRRSLGLRHDEVLALFAQRVRDYGAGVRRISPDQVPAEIAVRLVERGIRRVVVPRDAPPSWLPQYVHAQADDGRLTAADLDEVDGVITGSAVGIAETGTIVLDGGRLQGRRLLSLVPDYHLCVVATSDVVGNLSEALRRLDPARPLTFVSGPSATSDIELDRVEGVHGPRTLDVLLVG